MSYRCTMYACASQSYIYQVNCYKFSALEYLHVRCKSHKRRLKQFVMYSGWTEIRFQILANDQFDALFHVFIYFLSLYVSSITVLIIRRSNCINASSGIISLCKWPLGMPVWRTRISNEMLGQQNWKKYEVRSSHSEFSIVSQYGHIQWILIAVIRVHNAFFKVITSLTLNIPYYLQLAVFSTTLLVKWLIFRVSSPTNAVLTKVCYSDPKGTATSSQGIHGYISLMGTLKFTYLFN